MLRPAAILALLLASTLHAQNPKLQFEVASVRMSTPDGKFVPPRGGPGTPDPERIAFGATTFRNLLLYAYDVQPDQIQGPDWIKSDAESYTALLYDISAKIPAGATREQIPIMLQHLLEDRFQLTFHRETVQRSGLSLIVAKNGPKLKLSAEAIAASEEAQASPTAGVKLQAQKDGFPNLYPGRNQGGIYENGEVHMRFRRFPLSDLAEQLSIILGTRVVDKTALNGDYDFTLAFEVLQNAAFAGNMATLPLVHGPKAPVPSFTSQGQIDSVPIISQAMEKQLGLKLESAKVPVEIMVIDHVQKTPTEN